MSRISEFEKEKLKELLLSFPNSNELAIGLAKVISNKCKTVIEFDDAVDIICMNSSSCHSILSRKNISKDMLFQYVYKKQIPITSVQITKANLIDHIYGYWNNTKPLLSQSTTNENVDKIHTSPMNPSTYNEFSVRNTKSHQDDYTKTKIADNSDPENFPINALSRQFAEWFFNNLNTKTLQVTDFWLDSQIVITLTNGNNINEERIEGNILAEEKLHEIISNYNVYFNTNLNHTGVQGRMDVHGLVYTLACGTIHTTTLCVGVFEAVFGLSRDPFNDNNWKIKTLKIILRSETTQNYHDLSRAITLSPYVNLPQTNPIL